MRENMLLLIRTVAHWVRRHALGLLILSVATLFFISRFQLGINLSESMVGSVFLIDKKEKSVEVGELVAFSSQNAAPIPDGVTLIKRVAGVAGDRVTVKNRFVFINDKPVALAKPTSRTGEALQPITSVVIPEGFFFALGEHPDSFDSRYARPGLIPSNTVRGRAYRLR